MPDYVEIVSQSALDSNSPLVRELDFSSPEAFNAANRDRPSVTFWTQDVMAYFRTDDCGGKYELNSLGTALVWLWYGGGPAPMKVYGDLAIAGLPDLTDYNTGDPLVPTLLS